MFRLRFPGDRLPRGQRKHNLGRSGGAQEERSAYHLVHRNSGEGGIAPRSRTRIVQVHRNGAPPGILEDVEPIDGAYLDRWFPADAGGTLLKVSARALFDDDGRFRSRDTAWARLAYRGADRELYRYHFDLRTREREDDLSTLLRLLRSLGGAATVEGDEEIENVLDVDSFLNVLAARMACDDWDSLGLGHGHNAYLYHAPVEGRWKLLPWDLDGTWGNPRARTIPDADPGTAHLIGRPAFRRRYDRIVESMLADSFSIEHLDPLWSDFHRVVGELTGRSDPARLREFLLRRRERLASIVPEPVPFEIVRGDGLPEFVDTTELEVQGRGWVDIENILVGSEPVRMDWTSSTGWRASVPLEYGENQLVFTALGAEGEVLGSDIVWVNSTAGWPSPEITTITPSGARVGEVVTVTGLGFRDDARVYLGDVEVSKLPLSSQRPADSIQVIVEGAPGEVPVRVRNPDGRISRAASFTLLEPAHFIRGDANRDGRVEVGDALRILLALYRGQELGCPDAGDFDDDEVIEMGDGIGVLEYLFRGGRPPRPPFPAAGVDGVGEEGLDCDRLTH